MIRVEALRRIEKTVDRAKWVPFSGHDLRMVSVVAWREIQDTLRDWRLLFPILGLTLFFPGMMTIVARVVLDFLLEYNSGLIGERAIPMLMMVVGFFPTSFSLVIALEVFVGEKERKSLEPLLSTPLTNRQLFVGKLLAAVVPPVMAAYVGISFYALGITFVIGPMVGQEVLLVAVLTTVQALLMVSAAVVVSSQTTSTRAANMLASFIVVPVAIVLQFEAYLFAYYHYSALWWMIAAVTVLTYMFVRIGIQLFDRENLLGRSLDFLKFGWAARLWWRYFTGRDEEGNRPGIFGWYRQNWQIVRSLRTPTLILLGLFVAAALGGVVMTRYYPLPTEMLEGLRSAQMEANVYEIRARLQSLPVPIFAHNMRTIGIMLVLGTMTFGVITIISFMLPWALIAFIAAQFAMVGENPFVFVGATIVPHGWIELPALLLISASALKWQMTLISSPGKRLLSEIWLEASAEYFRLLLAFVVPMFFVASLLEIYLTPEVIIWVYGG